MSGSEDDDLLDLAAVAADDRAVESLRVARSISPDTAPVVDGRDDDRALALLRALLDDVGRDLPPGAPAREPLRLVSARSSRRLAGRTAAASAAAVVALSLGGVAAAATLTPAGTPLHGLGSAVRAAAGSVADAVTPDGPAQADAHRPAPPFSSPTPVPTVVAVQPTRTARPAAPGPVAVRPSPAGGQARSSAAAAAVARWLDQAEADLAAGRSAQASQRLDQAEKRLQDVPPADAAPLRARLERLRTEVSATAAPRATRAPAQDKPSRAPKAKKAPAGEAPAVRKGQDKAHGAAKH